jgi:cephalosporin-C deacetylase-like acetyl esterase
LGIRETDVAFECGDDACKGWFMVPELADVSLPCIVMAHGFGLTRRCGLRELAIAFVDADNRDSSCRFADSERTGMRQSISRARSPR